MLNFFFKLIIQSLAFLIQPWWLSGLERVSNSSRHSSKSRFNPRLEHLYGCIYMVAFPTLYNFFKWQNLQSLQLQFLSFKEFLQTLGWKKLHFSEQPLLFPTFGPNSLNFLQIFGCLNLHSSSFLLHLDCTWICTCVSCKKPSNQSGYKPKIRARPRANQEGCSKCVSPDAGRKADKKNVQHFFMNFRVIRPKLLQNLK